MTDTDIYAEVLNSYVAKKQELDAEKAKLSAISNKTLSKRREHQIVNDIYVRDLAQIERLTITMIYLLVCIGIIGLIYISIIPDTLGYILIGVVLVAYILTIIFVNNNFNERYNLNYAMFDFNPDIEGSVAVADAGSVPVCIPV